MVVLAFGFGVGVMSLTQAVVYGVDPDKAGVASALLNSAQQIGVALGLAVLAGVAAAVTGGHHDDVSASAAALVDGYGTALSVAAGVLFAAAVVALATLTSRVVSKSPMHAAVPGEAQLPLSQV